MCNFVDVAFVIAFPEWIRCRVDCRESIVNRWVVIGSLVFMAVCHYTAVRCESFEGWRQVERFSGKHRRPDKAIECLSLVQKPSELIVDHFKSYFLNFNNFFVTSLAMTQSLDRETREFAENFTFTLVWDGFLPANFANKHSVGSWGDDWMVSHHEMDKFETFSMWSRSTGLLI